ncbi:MAG: c-type cytochrome [Candidatus Promineifilaceae bacterium]
MSKTHFIPRLPLLLALIALVGVGTVIAQVAAAPSTPPDSAAGLATFGERCANCHGTAGLGDGELAANLPNQPTALGSSDFLRQAIPTDMFDTISNGRVESGMPPFGSASSNPLSEDSRWEAIAAIYSLGTSADSIAQGQTVYEENCLACHGESGAGDGEEAAGLSSPPANLTDLTYWSNVSNQSVFDLLADGSVPAHNFTLDEDSLWSVVDYIRTFSYLYSDPLAAAKPLEEASVSGVITNGTTGELAAEGTTVQLRAFTSNLDVALTMTTTVEAGGHYQFDLTNVSQDWFFRSAVFYQDIEFGSAFNQVSISQPELDLPIVIYEKTIDPGNLSIGQLHTIMEFTADDVVEVSQLYVVNNTGNTLYVGPTGNAEDGTFELTLPTDAQLIEFQRGFGSLDSFFPAEELIQTADGWADTLPVRPGQSTLVLLVRYSMAYDSSGTALSHPLLYDTDQVNLVVPEGISVSGSENWQDTGQQTLETGDFSTYQELDLTAGSALNITLEGRASQIATTGAGLVRNKSAELFIGGGIFLVMVAAAVFAIRRWQTPAHDAESEKEELLQAIADLDDEYEAGDISESEYLEERDDLLADLKDIWGE